MALARPIPPSFRSWIPVGERDYERPGRGTDTSGVVLELRRKNDGKPVWVQWWSKPEPGGKYTRSMFVDITDRVLMEQERARLVAENVYLRTRSAKFRRKCKSNSCALAALEPQPDEKAGNRPGTSAGPAGIMIQPRRQTP